MKSNDELVEAIFEHFNESMDIDDRLVRMIRTAVEQAQDPMRSIVAADLYQAGWQAAKESM